MNKTFVVATLAVSFFLAMPMAGHMRSATPAYAADDNLRDVNNRLDRMENAINDLQRSAYGGGSVAPGSAMPVQSGSGAAATQNRLLQLEDQIRVLTGRIEDLTFKIDQTNKDLQSFKEDTEFRFQDAGGAAPAAAAAASTASTPPAGAGSPDAVPSASGTLGTMRSADNAAESAPAASALPNGTPQVQYDYSIDLLKRGQFDQARDGFRAFLDVHPKDQLAGNAQYWLGETYYAQGDYKNAADAFLNGYTTYSTSTKAPDSLLKLGMTLKALGQKDASCATFGELGRRFPQASPAIVARNKLEQQKAGC